MSTAPTAPAADPIAAPKRPGFRPPLLRRTRFHPGPLRRDARRFGLAMPRFDAAPEAVLAPAPALGELRLFLHTFAAGFLFLTVFLA